MKKLFTVANLGIMTAALLSALALLVAGAGTDSARANHTVTLGLDLNPSAAPANTATSLGSIQDCLDVTAGPFNDDGDAQTDEDPLGDAGFNGNPDDDGDTLVDEDPPGQLFEFDVYITDVGSHGDPSLMAFSTASSARVSA